MDRQGQVVGAPGGFGGGGGVGQAAGVAVGGVPLQRRGQRRRGREETNVVQTLTVAIDRDAWTILQLDTEREREREHVSYETRREERERKERGGRERGERKRRERTQ